MSAVVFVKFGKTWIYEELTFAVALMHSWQNWDA